MKKQVMMWLVLFLVAGSMMAVGQTKQNIAKNIAASSGFKNG